ncbi:hypothetical protein VTN00DRAFT_6779 [Thermoascus crustaceus]|uniref:uncharacterized protein n=1 Tax=Thermoascus crustaceus TaxID=5088 RepID=UPI003742D8AA
MVYSSTAAVHALILAGIRKFMTPDYMYQNPEWVLVQSPGLDMQQPSASNESIEPQILPMVWDNDSDPVLTIVGATFMLLLPMQLWSDTLQKVQSKEKAVIFSWALLLFVGLISAIVNEAYIWLEWYVQFRFCPLDKEDSIPVPGSSVGGIWDYANRDGWNRTVQDYFTVGNLTAPRVSTHCLYTCFGSDAWPLREPSDAYAVPVDFDGIVVKANVLVTFFILVAFSTGGLITLAALANIPSIPDDLRPQKLAESFEKLKKDWNSYYSVPKKWWLVLLRTWILVNVVYAQVFTPITSFLFVAYMEWVMWNANPAAETFSHVGQWSLLVGAALALGAAGIHILWGEVEDKTECKCKCKDQHETEPTSKEPERVNSFQSDNSVQSNDSVQSTTPLVRRSSFAPWTNIWMPR